MRHLPRYVPKCAEVDHSRFCQLDRHQLIYYIINAESNVAGGGHLLRSVERGTVASAAGQADTRAISSGQAGQAVRASPSSCDLVARGASAERLPELDIARGAAVLLVVVMHASLLFPASVFFEQFNMVAAGLRMPLLMVVTGYLFMTTRKLGRRLIQFAWVFVVWTLITVAAQNIHQPGVIADLYLREFIVPTSALWFVWSAGLMGLSLIALRHVHTGIVLAVTAGLTMLNEAGLLDIRLYTLEHCVGNAFFFYVGAYHGASILRLAKEKWRTILLWGPVVMLALRGLDYWAVQSVGWQVIGIPERIVAILFAITLARWLALKAGAILAPIVWVGRNTMPIFVAHSLFVFPAAALFVAVQPEIAIVLLTISTVGASLLLHRLVLGCGLNWIYAAPDAIFQAIERGRDGWSKHAGEVSMSPARAARRSRERR